MEQKGENAVQQSPWWKWKMCLLLKNWRNFLVHPIEEFKDKTEETYQKIKQNHKLKENEWWKKRKKENLRVNWTTSKFGKKWKRKKHIGHHWRNNTRVFPIIEGQVLGLNETHWVSSTTNEKDPHQGTSLLNFRSGIRKRL